MAQLAEACCSSGELADEANLVQLLHNCCEALHADITAAGPTPPPAAATLPQLIPGRPGADFGAQPADERCSAVLHHSRGAGSVYTGAASLLPVVSMACFEGIAGAGCLPAAEHMVRQVHYMVLIVLVALTFVQLIVSASTALSCLCDRALLSCGTAAWTS